MATQFKFKLGDAVIIAVSGEKGEVIGRAQFIAWENQYSVRYKNALGTAVEAWWTESALTPEAIPQV